MADISKIQLPNGTVCNIKSYKLSTDAGTTDRPVYFSGGVPVQCNTPDTGSWFEGVPLIKTDGVMEIGKYIDFHKSNDSTADYDLRLQYTGTATSSSVILTLPAVTGTVPSFTATPTSGQVVITNGTGGGIKSSGNTITATPSGKVNTNWGTASDRTTIVTKGWMSYWDGSYDGSASNLTYCNKGAFGTIVTKSTTDYSKVSFSRNLTSGTKVGTITIDGTATDLYCQTNTNTDTKVNVTLATTTKAYLLATSTTPTSSAQAVTSVSDTGVYLGAEAGSLYATDYHTSGGARGYFLVDKASNSYGGVYDNGSNLWIGAVQSADYHHKGSTYISTGWDGTLPTTAGAYLTGNTTIIIGVPKYAVDSNGKGHWDYTGYAAIHAGNYTSYTVTKTGGGASGSWGISITGNAATATKATQDGDGNTISSTYLPLSGGSLSGSMNFKSTTYDGSAANNGVSSGIAYPTTFNILDKSSRILVRLEGVINSSGSIGSYWYVRNYNTSGTHVGQKGISMTMAKDGTLTYAVSDGDKFRSAIGAGTSSLTIGTTSTTAAAGDHGHGLLHSDLTQAATNGTTGGWSVIGIDPAVTGYVLKSIRINEHSPNWLSGNYGAGIAFGGYDTKGVISMNYHLPAITFAGGNHSSSKTEPVWYFKISGTSGSTYNLDNLYGKLYNAGTGCSWWNDRDNAVIRITTGDTQYRPLWTLLTATSGSWGMGNYTGDDLTFNFISKAVYDSKANPSKDVQIKFTNTGAITANGLTLSSSDYGPLSIIRTGHPWHAGIKFYNNGSTYLGSFGITTANGTFVRFNTDEKTSYEIIDRSVVRNNTTVGTLGWTSVSADTVIPTVNTIAYWNGAHSGTSSNLAYCKKGEFGTIITKNTGDYVPNHGNLKGTIGDNSPATDVKTFFMTSSVPTGTSSIGYNTGGNEYTLIFGKGVNTAGYGAVLKFGYDSLYPLMLRIQNGTWKSTDWEKISAGYADSAGTATKVKGTLTEPTTETTYAIPFHSGISTGDKTLLNNNGLRYTSKQGGGAIGVARITLGLFDSSASTTAKQTGELSLISQDGPTGTLRSKATANRVAYLPDITGTLAIQEQSLTIRKLAISAFVLSTSTVQKTITIPNNAEFIRVLIQITLNNQVAKIDTVDIFISNLTEQHITTFLMNGEVHAYTIFSLSNPTSGYDSNHKNYKLNCSCYNFFSITNPSDGTTTMYNFTSKEKIEVIKVYVGWYPNQVL